MTSTVDWCEPNYLATSLIAEPWNTVSSLAMVVAGLLGLLRHRELAGRYRVAFSLLVLVGLGSIAFHASLRFGTQLLDELPMVYLVLVIVYVLTGARRRWPFALVAAVMTALASGTRGQVQFYVFQIGFGAMELFALAKTYLLQRRAAAPIRKLYRYGMLAYAVAVTVWFIDIRFCGTVGDLKLHALWHVLVSAGFYALLLVIARSMPPAAHEQPSAQ
ncbi:MAG: ceramidase domain-containing protein [Myxococcota bacterium]